MARSYANIVTSIWRDAEFCGLSAGAQRTYFMLISQPDISAAGTLPLRLKRWAKTLRQDQQHHLSEWLNELADHHYIVVDLEAEELLVRSFIRWDRGYTNSKRQPVILEAMSLVTSPELQEVLRSESDKLGFDYKESLPQVNRVSDRVSRFDRVVVKEVGSTPQPTTHKPQTVENAIPDRPTSKPVKPRAVKMARAYQAKIKTCNFGHVVTAVEVALSSGEYTDEQIEQAIARLSNNRRIGVTPDSIRIEIDSGGKKRLLNGLTEDNGAILNTEGRAIAGQGWDYSG